LANIKNCMRLLCALACVLVMGLCPGGASCSSSDNLVDLRHVVHHECCDFAHDSFEVRFCFDHVTAEHWDHKCCRQCPDSHFHVGCGVGLTLSNRIRPMVINTFAFIDALTNDAVLTQEDLSPQSLGLANVSLLFLRTVILLT